MGIASVEVVGFAKNPVDRGLAAALAAALRRRLSNDELLRLAEAVHGHGFRSGHVVFDGGLLVF